MKKTTSRNMMLVNCQTWLAPILVVLALATPAQARDPLRSAQEAMPLLKETAPPQQQPPPAPGAVADLPLGFGNNEPSIAVDPNNPLRVAVATYLSIRVSIDGGKTFLAAVPASLPATHNSSRGGDSSLAYDSQGRLFWAYLAVTNGTSAPDIFLAQHNPTTGAVIPGYPVNVTASPGVNLPAGPNSHDKQWLAIDSHSGSPFQDRIYLAWTDLTGAAVVRSVFSANQGQTWTLAAPLSVAAEGFPWPTHNTVAPNGDLYVSYHSQTGSDASGADDLISGKVYLLRSTDGGATFPQKNLAYAAGAADVTDNVQTQNGPIPGARFWLLGTGQAWVLADPITAGRLYVVANDDPNNSSTGDAANVYITISTNFGVNWTTPARIDRGPGNSFQVMPVANIDPVQGCIAVHYYDNRRGLTNAAGRFLLDVFATTSHDGGVTFAPDFRINDTPFDPDPGAGCRFNCPTNPTTRIGEYNGLAVVGGVGYAVWTGNTFDGSGNAVGQQTIFDRFAACDLPVITIPSDVFFDDTCGGATNYETLYVCNTGKADLQVGPITSTNSQFAVVTPSSGYPVAISPDFCFPFRVRFSPASTGDKETTFIVPSNDPFSPTNFVRGFGQGVGPRNSAFMADSGNFGDVCLGSFKDLNLTINNAGGCTLIISNITSTLGSQFIVPVVLSYPLVLQPGDSVAVPIRFQPTSLGLKTASILIASNDPLSPKFVPVSGNVPPGDIRVTGSTDFADVCAGKQAEKTISICNVGKCNLTVTNVAFVPPCADFILVNNPFPAIVSHDSCLAVVIRFTPTSCGPKNCNLRITTDDPDTPVINLPVTANTACASIDVPPDLGFPPEVIQSAGACSTLLPFPISNKGECNLVITNITIGGVNAGDFSLSGLPSFPIILEPGHIVGEGDLNVVFAPTAIARARTATISVTYISDPFTGATTTVTRALCGEGVYTGARVLVMHGGVPVAQVEKMHLQRINANRNKPILDTTDQAMNLPLVTVVPTAPCGPFQYHREYGTVSNPIQLLPGSYQVTASAIINGKRKSLSVGFDVSTCDFNPNIVINF